MHAAVPHLQHHYLSKLPYLSQLMLTCSWLCLAADDPYCTFDNQRLQWFTSSLFVAGMLASYPAEWLNRCSLPHLAPACAVPSAKLGGQLMYTLARSYNTGQGARGMGWGGER